MTQKPHVRQRSLSHLVFNRKTFTEVYFNVQFTGKTRTKAVRHLGEKLVVHRLIGTTFNNYQFSFN